MALSKIERDNSHKRPCGKRRATSGPDEKTIGVCENAHERTVLITDRRGPILGKLGAHIVLTLTIRVQRDGKPDDAGFIAARAPEKTVEQRLQKNAGADDCGCGVAGHA